MQQVSVAYAPVPPSSPRIAPLEGVLAFASEQEQEQRSVELLGAGALLVRLPPPTSHVRGHLGSLLEELVERELARAGAPSPYLAAWTAMPDEANARLADQLLRAQAVGASGLAIALGTLKHIAQPSLCTDDSALLRWLAEATTALPLVLLIDDADMHLGGYAAPKPLMDLLVTHDPPVVLIGDDATAIETVVSAPVPSIDMSEALTHTPSFGSITTATTALSVAPHTSAEPAHALSTDAADVALPNGDAADVSISSARAEAADELSAHGAETDGSAVTARSVLEEISDVVALDAEAATPARATESAAPADDLALPNSGSERAEAVVELSVHARVTGGETDTLDVAEAIVALDAEATTRRLPLRRRATSGAALLEAVMTPPAPAANSAEQIAAENGTAGDRDEALSPSSDDAPAHAASNAPPRKRAITVAATPAAIAGNGQATTSAEQIAGENAAAATDEAPRTRTAGRVRTARSAVAGAIESGPNDAWRTWLLALSHARGAQPLAAFEKLFIESYVPLANAIAAGLEDARAVRAVDDFRRSFERSYTDAFATFGATNRKPRLVMDTFDLANKAARLASARAPHVLIVDSMRFDLGTMVKDVLTRETSGIAHLQSETLLWAALPTTTMRQLETLSRGIDAIRAPAPEEPSESLRGRAAEVVRRCRLGSREAYKLDLVPALLESAGTNVVSELPAIAQAAAEAIARHVTTLAPRTLLYIVGDHGFSIDRRGQIQTGGASPEEVLVPAQAWLIGDLH